MPFMISCREASELVSKKLDQPLGLTEGLRLRFHLLMCKACPTLHQKLEVLHQAGQRYALEDRECDGGSAPLSAEARERIAARLRETGKSRDAG